MSTATTFITKDGTRKAEMISLDGSPVFVITDPRHRSQAPDVLGYVPVQTVTLLHPFTVAALRGHGISEADLQEWGLVS